MHSLLGHKVWSGHWWHVRLKRRFTGTTSWRLLKIILQALDFFSLAKILSTRDQIFVFTKITLGTWRWIARDKTNLEALEVVQVITFWGDGKGDKDSVLILRVESMSIRDWWPVGEERGGLTIHRFLIWGSLRIREGRDLWEKVINYLEQVTEFWAHGTSRASRWKCVELLNNHCVHARSALCVTADPVQECGWEWR